jgi:hypothetical protein
MLRRREEIQMSEVGAMVGATGSVEMGCLPGRFDPPVFGAGLLTTDQSTGARRMPRSRDPLQHQGCG